MAYSTVILQQVRVSALVSLSLSFSSLCALLSLLYTFAISLDSGKHYTLSLSLSEFHIISLLFLIFNTILCYFQTPWGLKAYALPCALAFESFANKLQINCVFVSTISLLYLIYICSSSFDFSTIFLLFRRFLGIVAVLPSKHKVLRAILLDLLLYTHQNVAFEVSYYPIWLKLFV